MSVKCPYCGGPMQNLEADYNLTTRQKAIFNEVMKSSRNGVSQEQLMSKFFKRKSDISLRTAVHNINKKIAPIFIESRDKLYRVREGGSAAE
jgi:hypothetical protein